MATNNRPTQEYIATITIVRYMDVRATSKESATRMVLREMPRLHGQEARLTKIQRG
jgi:hypothetical protein